jgi:hypothetical protein
LIIHLLLLLAGTPTACNEWEFYFVISFMREKGIVGGDANNSRVLFFMFIFN